RDADKVWCRFIGSRHLAYLYGSGRLFIVSSRNLSGLDGIWWLEDDLSWFLDRVQAASALDDASKWAARGCLTAVYSQQTGAYVRTRIVPTSFARFDGRLRVPDPAPSAARAVLDSLDQGGALYYFDVAGSSLKWKGAEHTYSRVYAQLAPTAGDHGTYVRNYDHRRARVYIEAFFPSGLTADDDFTLISDNGACGIETLVSKHMSELVLGP
ncbi:MAG TPA: hypothetical protein PLQ54_19815, partial [Armatimonadota bacterium]|nr:hypothetical protein [Armatimonadota bacterium]